MCTKCVVDNLAFFCFIRKFANRKSIFVYMRKIIVTTLLFITILYARAEELSLYCSDDKDKGNPRNETPKVFHEEDELVITCDSLIRNAWVIVKNETGEIVAKKKLNISQAFYTISLPQTNEKDRYTVEISNEETNWQGSFIH